MLLVLFLLGVASYITSYRLPGSCEPGQFYDPSLMDCLTCPANVSLVTATDGFGCACEEHSIPVGMNRCRRCNITEVVASDGLSCVPRRCQSAAGRISCRKCPRDYISVTRNFDGSPMKEVQCVKCARGHKAVDDRCERCEACSCSKNEVVVKGKCVPKKYLLDRPKYTENRLHPDELLEIVKLEFLCTKQDIRACRALASACVRNFYTPEFAGPCRLWTQPKFANFKGLPLLTIDSTKHKTEFSLERGRDTLMIAMAKHTSDGGFQIFTEAKESAKLCLSAMKIKIGEDTSLKCVHNISELTSSDYTNIIYEFYLLSEKDLDPLPVFIRKPNGYYVKNDAWSTKGNFRKLFLINKYLSTTTNTTSTVYLRTLLIQVIIHRDKSEAGNLRLRLNLDAQYTTLDSDEVTTTLVVEHNMPNAGVSYMLQIFGGVFGAVMFVLGLVQWRGAVRRGGAYVGIVPLIASSVADALHFATLVSTLHALAAEAGTLGLTLPLSQEEENVIEILVYTCVSLKCLKVLWFNWNQCRCDIFFVDWSRYNPSIEEITIPDKSKQWKTDMLAKEWSFLQTKRRVLPGYTITMTLLVLHFFLPQSPVPRSRGYKLVTALVTWWCAYFILLVTRFLVDKLLEPQPNGLVKVCADLEMSMMVFQEEYYAHYVNGRNADAMDFRSMTHPLSSCRIVCAPQLRTVYKKLSVSGLTGLKDGQSNRELLNQFLAAFFERALDGLNWVASERTIIEKLLDVELVTREGGNTSVLIYDADFTTPSCFAMTWRGEEWTLATFDAMLFGCILIASDQTLLAALITLMVWKIMNIARMLFGNWNVQRKIKLIN